MIVGVDFGAPRRARDQRRKILAIAAQPTGRRSYRVAATGLNARLLANPTPGWNARELIDELVARPARSIGFDFPFGVPHQLLSDPWFASAVGYPDGAFHEWRAFNEWIARRLPLTDPLDFTPFAPWYSRAERARLWTKRATDRATGAQPPLKNLFQATLQMTLLGNVVLAELRASHHYRVLPFPGGRGEGEVIEVYPGATLRQWGLASYKARPQEAVHRGLAACAAAGLELHLAPELLDAACRYSSGPAGAPDHDLADAFVALCTAILYAEDACHAPLALDPTCPEPLLKEREGAIWVPSPTPAAR